MTDTIIHGNSIEEMSAMPKHSVDLIFADPPYNMQLADDLQRPDGSLVDAVNDDWDQFISFAVYDQFTRDWLTAALHVLKPNGSLWVMGSYHNIHRVGTILQDLGFWVLNEITWVKMNPTPQMKGTRFCNAHETLLWAIPNKKSKYTFNYQLMKAANEDKQMRSDWYFNICQGKERIMGDDGKKAHSTQKPESLLRRVILSSTREGDVVLDPFIGSGTSAAVAKKLGRHSIGIDLSEKNVATSTKRLGGIIFGEDLSTVEGNLIGGKKPKLAFVSLVEHGYLKAGDRLKLMVQKVDHFAAVNQDGTITLIAASEEDAVKGSIHQVGKHVQKAPSCNGWTNWEYYDAQAQLWTSLDALRALAVAELASAPEPEETE